MWHLCGCVCLSNPHLPTQFQDHHSDGYNDQWQSELQLRAGISVPSHPIRAEMSRNLEGQTKPHESIHMCTYTGLQAKLIYVLQLTYTFTTYTFMSLFALKKTKGWKCHCPSRLLSSTRRCRKKIAHSTARKQLIEQLFWSSPEWEDPCDSQQELNFMIKVNWDLRSRKQRFT